MLVAIACACASSAVFADDQSTKAAHDLARRWAPVYVQHVAINDRGADRPTRIDFDGNWDATDNWSNQGRLGTRVPPAAYAAPILTATHAYVTYTLFYPRDWSRICVPFVCHDNDLETIQLVIERSGKLVEVRAKAHHQLEITRGDDIARSTDGRPMFRVESHGHGIAPCKLVDPRCLPRANRIVYAPGAIASAQPARALGQTVHYELLWLHSTLWSRRHRDHDRLWTDGETGPLYYVGAKRGRAGHAMGASMAHARFIGGVRPPWALAAPGGKRGDWFLDPAATGSYDYNPFLDDLDGECRGAHCKPAPKQRNKWSYYLKLGAPYIAVGLGVVGVGAWMRLRGVGPQF